MNRITPILLLAFVAFSCANSTQNSDTNEALTLLRAELDSLKEVTSLNPTNMKGQIATFLTFQKEDAEQAMNFYVELFPNSQVMDLQRWGTEGGGKEGTIMQAIFTLNGKLYMCSDSPPIHDWDFTPAVSNFVVCSDQSELERLFTKLSENGQVMMPLDNYGFSQQFGFVQDRFGVSWQLNLP